MSEGPAEQQDALPIVGLIEIAMAAGVKRNTVTSWRARYPDFPAPIRELAVGPVFWWPDVADWLTRSGRRFDAEWSREDTRPAWDSQSVRGKVQRWATRFDTGHA